MHRKNGNFVKQLPGEFRILPWRKALDRYGNDLTRMVRSLRLSPTHLPGWMDIVFSTKGITEAVQVLLTEHDDRLTGAVPFYLTEQVILGMNVKVLDLGTNFISYHASSISEIEFDNVLEYLTLAVPDWHILRAFNLVDGSACSEGLKSYARRESILVERFEAEQSPYLRIENGWQSFLQSKNKKFRYKLRQREQILLNDDRMSVETITGSNYQPDLFQAILDVDKSSWKARYGLDIAARDDEREYYRKLLPFLAASDLIHLVILRRDAQPIAYSLCVSFETWFGQLKTSFDEGFSEFSPGAIVIDQSIRSAFEAQAHEFDFLGDTDQHKLSWTKSIRSHSSYFLYANRLKAKAIYFAKRMKRTLLPAERVATTKQSQT